MYYLRDKFIKNLIKKYNKNVRRPDGIYRNDLRSILAEKVKSRGWDGS